MKYNLLRNSILSGSLFLVFALVFAACESATLPTSPDGGDSPALSASKVGGQALDSRYIVVLNGEFAPGGRVANRQAATDVAHDLGLSPVHTYGSAIFGFAAAIPEARLNGLRRDSRIAYVEADAPLSIPTPVRAQAPKWCTPDSTHPACAGDDSGGDSGETLPWGVDRIDADLNSNSGAGIHVYVIDTGIDADHADLQANLGNGFAVEECKGGSCTTSWDDDHDHGTHVAGTVGALDNDIDVVGVAPTVTLHAVKVLAKNGMGSRSGVIAGIDWVTGEVSERGEAAVANMSLGGSGSKKGACTSSGYDNTDGDDSYHQAICNSVNVGVVYVVAAGNDGADAENAVPAAYDDAVITVSATNSTDQWESWSNWGDNSALWTSNVSAPVAIGAPGGNILSTKAGGGTTTMSGTSMASPHVAGAAALYLKSNTQSADYSAFTSVRSGLLSADEDASGFGTEDKSNPHEEDFVNAETL